MAVLLLVFATHKKKLKKTIRLVFGSDFISSSYTNSPSRPENNYSPFLSFIRGEVLT